MKKLIAGNWKMNGTLAAAEALARDVAAGIAAAPDLTKRCDFLVCPPFVHLVAVKAVLGAAPVVLGAQDCALNGNGAYTGDISASMLKDMGCTHVILGHSERRQYHGETDETIAAKAKMAHAAGLVAVICVGERENQRDAGHELDVVRDQLARALPDTATADNTVIAYEPVWAIGTGKTASPEDVRVMHNFIRERLVGRLAEFARMRILYGGSMKPDNAGALLAVPHVDGGLIGGASLKAADYLGIARSA